METQGTAMVMEQLEKAQAAGKSIVMTKQVADVYFADRTYTYTELIDEHLFWFITLNTRCTLKDNKIVTRHCRSEEHTSELPVTRSSRMPSSA